MLVRLSLLVGVVGEVLVRGQQGLDGEGGSDWCHVPHTAAVHLVQSNLTIYYFTIRWLKRNPKLTKFPTKRHRKSD